MPDRKRRWPRVRGMGFKADLRQPQFLAEGAFWGSCTPYSFLSPEVNNDLQLPKM